jgi:hypothetical protein
MWIRAEFSLSETQAYAMCKVAQRFQSIEAAGNIKPSALLFLARSTVPDEAVKEIVEKAATGKTVGYAEAKTISKKHGYKPLHNPKAAQSLTPAPKPATMPAGGPLIQEMQNRVLELANVVGPAFMSQLLRKLADQLDGSGADNSAAIAELPGDTIDAECISKSELVTAGV